VIRPGAGPARLPLGERGEDLAGIAAGIGHELTNLFAAAAMAVDLLAPACTGKRERRLLEALAEVTRDGLALTERVENLARALKAPPPGGEVG
jgi:signal transduction histidine kinase